MNTRKMTPIMALTIIRQILRGEGEYAVIADRGDQHDAISEIVDQVLNPMQGRGRKSLPHLVVPPAQSVGRINPENQAFFEQLVTETIKSDFWITQVAGASAAVAVFSMPDTIAAVFDGPRTTATFETFGHDPAKPGPTFWVKFNNTPGQAFLEEWHPDAERFVMSAIRSVMGR